MPEFEEMLARLKAMRQPTGGQWFRVEAKADQADVYIYDEIGPFTTSAQELVDQVRAIKASDITVHLNTPGGDAFGGIALYNTLKDHPAKVTVVVDGMAASAGSLIAQAGDTVRMNRGSQMMIHDAAGVAIGRAADMESVASMLNKLSDSMAGIYAARSGGSVEDWRAAMRAESWYSAAEAVEAGLADEVIDPADAGPQATASWDLAAYAYAYAGRDKAPPPWSPPKPEAPATPGASAFPTTAAEAARQIHAVSNEKGAGMSSLAKYREALAGLPDAASDEEVKSALASAGLAQPDPPTEPDPEPTPKPGDPDPAPQQRVTAAGTMVIDVSAWQEREERIKRLEAADARRRVEERDQVIAAAVAEGKFAPARKAHWERLWNADPEGTRQAIDGLATNVFPVQATGYAGGSGDADTFGLDFGHMWAPGTFDREGARRG